jgi:hypothetical protein
MKIFSSLKIYQYVFLIIIIIKKFYLIYIIFDVKNYKIIIVIITINEFYMSMQSTYYLYLSKEQKIKKSNSNQKQIFYKLIDFLQILSEAKDKLYIYIYLYLYL